MSHRSPRDAGFTLLEVMVAVVLLGIVVVQVTLVSANGMRVEGESRRRLDASLLADQLLADLETVALQGEVPELGTTEAEEEPYRIQIETRPLDAESLGLLEARDPELGPATALVGTEGLGSSSPLVEIQITVSWEEGFDTLEVRRTTFAFDAAAVAAQIPASGTGAEGAAEGDQG